MTEILSFDDEIDRLKANKREWRYFRSLGPITKSAPTLPPVPPAWLGLTEFLFHGLTLFAFARRSQLAKSLS